MRPASRPPDALKKKIRERVCTLSLSLSLFLSFYTHAHAHTHTHLIEALCNLFFEIKEKLVDVLLGPFCMSRGLVGLDGGVQRLVSGIEV